MDFKKPNTIIEWENFCSSIRDNINAVGKRDYVDGANIPDGFIRYNRVNQTFEEYTVGVGFSPIDIEFESMIVTGLPMTGQSIGSVNSYKSSFLKICPDSTDWFFFENNACEMAFPETFGPKKFRVIVNANWESGGTAYTGHALLKFSPASNALYEYDFLYSGFNNNVHQTDRLIVPRDTSGIQISGNFFPFMTIIDIIIFEENYSVADVIIQGYSYNFNSPNTNAFNYFGYGRVFCGSKITGIKLERNGSTINIGGNAFMFQHPMDELFEV